MPISCAVASFAGVENRHLRSNLQSGETVLDLGSGAGLDAIIASWQVGPAGQVIGVDLNPTMLPATSIDVILSKGVINLSFRERRVIEAMFACSGRRAGFDHRQLSVPSSSRNPW